MNLLLVKDISVMGFNWGTYWGWSPNDERVRFQPVRQRAMDELTALYDAGVIRPRVHGEWPLEQFREAWAGSPRSALGWPRRADALKAAGSLLPGASVRAIDPCLSGGT